MGSNGCRAASQERWAMSDDSRRSELLDLAYPYALDALSDADRREAERLLDEADESTAGEFCDTVRAVRETLASMTVIHAVPAPPNVEEALLRAIDDHSAVVDGLSERRDRARRLRWLVAAAALVVAIAVGAGIVSYLGRPDDTGQVTAQQVIAEPDTRNRVVQSANGGAMSVFSSPGLAAAAVLFDDMPPPPPGKVYQMWLIPAGGQPYSVGVMDSLPTPDAPRVVRTGDAAQLAVSVEPEGGSVQPTTEPVVAVPLG
ncbi:anti-sigma factor [Nocardia cyriacigeorgica]|uniref:anti-sigma factor n=2 Tax=Nocardia cyriacigeorgica TaxID=135487 RepID=UPI001892F38F|nr:anti-sigma factor [Nocardia cyriacigeorgica]MBF6399652.1 anti-sigma factor [Nocardia cyriacigeorgica]MBF6514190.1 anti-sigma factor [Nocardia cyriacigeorgica]